MTNECEVKVKFAPPTTTNDLLGRKLSDGSHLDLTTSPLQFFKVERPTQVSEYGVMMLYRMDGYRLWHFLNTIAPLPYSTDVRGVLADWRMPDNDNQRKLHQRHRESLGQNWDIFEQSRRIFMETLYFDPSLQSQRTAHDLNSFLQMYWEVTCFANNMISTDSPPQLQQMFISLLRNRPEFRYTNWAQTAASVDVIREKVHQLSSNWRFRYVADSLLIATLGSDDPVIRQFAVEGHNAVNPKGTVLELVDGKVMVRVGQLLRGEVVFTPTHHGKKLWAMHPETVVSANYLVPTLRWGKDARGERKWNTDFLEQPVIKHLEQWIKPPEDFSFDSRRFNPVIGIAIIPYFIPSLRASWPKYQAFRDGQRGNFMGPAQVPVLALQRKEDLLDSEFFAAAEQYIKKHI